MSVRLALPALTATILAGDVSARQIDAPIDRDDALSASAEALARRAFAVAAPRFVEVSRPALGIPPGHEPPVDALLFATAPTDAGSPGLCRATTAWIQLDRPHSDPLSTETVYKVVGEPNPLPDTWDRAYERRLQSLCRGAGRVIAEHSDDVSQPGFFRASGLGDFETWRAVLALHMARAAAEAGAPVHCMPDSPIDHTLFDESSADEAEIRERLENRVACADPRPVLAALDLGRLLDLEDTPCPNADAEVRCLSATVLRYAYFNHQATWRVSVRYRTSRGEDRGVASVEGLMLQPSFNVYG